MRCLLSALVLAFGIHAAFAQQIQPTGCQPAAEMMAVLQALPDYASHYDATGDEVAAAAGIFNAVPPVSDIAWTMAILVSLKDGSGGMIVGFGEMACGTMRVQNPVRWRAVVHGVRGGEV